MAETDRGAQVIAFPGTPGLSYQQQPVPGGGKQAPDLGAISYMGPQPRLVAGMGGLLTPTPQQVQQISAQREAPKQPLAGEYADLPITSYVLWDRKEQIEGVLRAHEQGQFNAPALLWDAMWRDDRIYGVLRARTAALLSTPLLIDPPRDNAKGQAIADLLKDSDKKQGLYQRMFPASHKAEILQWGMGVGIGLGELLWDTQAIVGGKQQWVPRVKIWHPQFIYWRWDTKSYWVSTMDGPLELPNTDRELHSDGKWIIYTPYGYRYGWLRALIRPLAQVYLDRGWTRRDWNRYNEVHGLPIRKAITPKDGNDKHKRRFFNQLTNIGSESNIETPQGKEGERYDIELVEAKADTYNGFKERLDKLETDAAITVNGQNLTTEVRGGSLGNGGGAQVHNQVRDDVARLDATNMEDVEVNQLLHHWAVFNYGSDDWCPPLRYQVDPPEEDADEASALAALANALVAFADAQAPVDIRAVLEDFGIPMLDADVWAEQLAAAQPPDVAAVQEEIGNAADLEDLRGRLAKRFGGAGGGRPATATPGAPRPTGGGTAPTPAPAERKPPERTAAARLLAERLVVLRYGGKDYTLPDDHLAAMPVAKGGSSCSSCAYLGSDRASCTNPRYVAWNGGDRRLLDPETGAEVPADQFCSDWWEPLAGNHPVVDRYQWAGFTIAVENKQGSSRKWVDPQTGTAGQSPMYWDYGYLEGYVGADGDEIDVYVGPREDAAEVYVVHQMRGPDYQVFDEDKVMLGWSSADAAKAAYLQQYDAAGPKIYGGMSVIPIERFRAKLQRRTGSGRIRASVADDPAVVALDQRALAGLVALRVVHRADGWWAITGGGERGPYAHRPLAIAALTEAEVLPAPTTYPVVGSEPVLLTAPRTARTKAGVKRAKRYQDRVAARARDRGRAAVQVDLRAVMEAVTAATSYADLRQRLARAFKHMRPEALAKVVERARIMCELAGRHDVLKDL